MNMANALRLYSIRKAGKTSLTLGTAMTISRCANPAEAVEDLYANLAGFTKCYSMGLLCRRQKTAQGDLEVIKTRWQSLDLEIPGLVADG